jgi:hypothetical protein
VILHWRIIADALIEAVYYCKVGMCLLIVLLRSLDWREQRLSLIRGAFRSICCPLGFEKPRYLSRWFDQCSRCGGGW